MRKFLQQGAGSGSPAGGQPRQHARSQRTARTPSGGARLAQRTSRNHGTAGRHPTDNLQSGCQHHPERLTRVQASGGECLLTWRLEKGKDEKCQNFYFKPLSRGDCPCSPKPRRSFKMQKTYRIKSGHCRKETVHAVPSLGVDSKI